jgi:hypothetical protein
LGVGTGVGIGVGTGVGVGVGTGVGVGVGTGVGVGVGIDTSKGVEVGDLGVDVDVGVVGIASFFTIGLVLLGIKGHDCATRRAIEAKVIKAVSITMPDANRG